MKIAVGLSGGVDSAVSAALLKEMGHEVIGIFMKNWSDDYGIEGDCPWEKDLADAKSVADFLKMEFLSYNFELEYRERVIEYFFQEYRKGRTPNPDILCNREIKFNLFVEKAINELQVDKIATGHYAIVKEFSNKMHLFKGKDRSKDQSYFLCRLTQDQLRKATFPVGHLQKSEVRMIAKKMGIPVAEKKDSQGICFVGKLNVRKFLEKNLGTAEGNIIDIDSGKILGRHNGVWLYTNGQRKGMGLGGGPWFVVKKDIETNTLYVAKGDDNPHLYSTKITLFDINFINDTYDRKINYIIDADVVFRYRQKPAKAKVIFIYDENDGLKLEVSTNKPQRAATPGQFGCIYIGEELIASGVISDSN